MARKGIGDFPKVNPTKEVTGKGIAVLLSFFVPSPLHADHSCRYKYPIRAAHGLHGL